jgi:hypothetical protein
MVAYLLPDFGQLLAISLLALRQGLPETAVIFSFLLRQEGGEMHALCDNHGYGKYR